MLIQSESDPMTFAVRLAFKGSICFKTLETSVLEAANSHPLLTSCVRSDDDSVSIFRTPPNELRWVPSNLPPVINELSLDDSGLPLDLTPQSDRIDLSRENGFKTFVAEHNGKTDVHFLFHHAACDGLGGFKFAEEVLARYHAAKTSTKFPIPAFDSELLKFRNPKCKNLLTWYRRLIRSGFVLPRRLFGMTGNSFAKIATNSIDPDAKANQPVSAVLEMPTLTLSSEETATISRNAAERQSTTNEFLLDRLCQVLFAWNQKFAANEAGKIRAIIPFSLRNSTHETMPAANCVSMVYVDSLAANENDSLAAISKQFRFIRKWQIEYSWSQIAGFAFRSKRIATLLRKQSSRHLCTTVLSNLGRPFKHSELPVQEDGCIQAGNLILQSAHLAAPTTANTITTFGALFYASRLTLTMNYSKAKMTRDDAQDLMKLWGKSLTCLA